MHKPLTAVLALAFSAIAAAAPLRVAVVDTGDAGSAEIAKCIAGHGAKVERTTIADGKLEGADVAVLYADEPKPLPPESRGVLEAFAKRGGGLVILHGGIGAGDVNWWKALAGGAWTGQSQKFMSRMMLYTVPDVHPIMHEASPFDIDDETYYDLETDPGIQVLASTFTPKITNNRRAERARQQSGDRASIYDIQPQAWVYEAPDRHRAFVMLPGQPGTLKHTSIQSFILRGIAWAARRENVDELCTKEELASLRYPKDGPRRAQDTIAQFEMQPGFKATVVASEPLINKPIAIQWDARGRLWVAETPEYPNGRRPLVSEPWKETGVLEPGHYDRPATDRISILEDTDGDGVMDSKKVFYEGLELVTGFCFSGDGVIAIAEPDCVFLHDTDGDDKADKVERIFTGHTPGDTHFVANHYEAGMDGWIYANTGGGAADRSPEDKRQIAKISSGLFRFKTDGSAIEQVGSKGGNGFGMDITSDFELFFGQATSGSPVQHVVLPEAVLAKGKVGSTGSVESVIRNRKVVRADMPSRAALMQIDVVGGYSAACSSLIYEGGAWPAEWERGIFCTEPILDIIHHEKLVPSGTTFTGEMVRTDEEWLRSRDYWFFPVDVTTGPDGAMYVLDFYNPVVAHSDSRGPQHSRAGASVRPDRDHYFGRIYRIQHEQARKLDVPNLAKADTAGLAAALAHPNRMVRFTAQRLLVEKGGQDVVAALEPLALTGAPATRILALWGLQRLHALSHAALEGALRDADPGVRKNALLILEAAGGKDVPNITALLDDADPRVRLTALRVLSSTSLTPATASALLAVLPKLQDDWSKSAAVAAASSSPAPFIQAALATKGAPAGTLIELSASLAALLAEKQDAEGMVHILDAAAKAQAEAQPLVRAVLVAAAGKHLPVLTGADTPLKVLLGSADVSIAAAALPFAASAGDGLKPLVGRQIATLLPLTADAQQSDATRSAAVLALVRSHSADARIVPAMIELLKTKLSDSLALDVVAALAATGDPELGKPMIDVLANLSLVGQSALFDALASRADWSNAVLDALQAGTLKPALLGPARLSKLRLHPDAATSKRAIKLIDELGGGTNPQKAEIIAKLLPEVESKPGDAAKGKAAFAGACAICHSVNGEGKEVGPKLDGIGVHGTAEMLTHIIDPSRVVDNEHRTWNLSLKNGTFVTGIIARENDRSITVRLPGGMEQEIRTAEIKSRQDTGLSLMPEGLEALGAETLRDIIAYLSGGSSKYKAINLGRVFTTDTAGGGLYQSREAKNDTVQPVRYGVVIVAGVPFSLPDPTTTPTGGNVIVLKGGGRETFAFTMPARVEIPVGFAASQLHFLGGVAGWGGGPDSVRPAMKLTVVHRDGKKEVREFQTGDVFLDYVSGGEVPHSQRAADVVKRTHVRTFAVPVEGGSPIERLVLESYGNGIAPTTLAITAEVAGAQPPVTH